MKIDEILAEIKAERERQKTKWSLEHDRHHLMRDWISIIGLLATKLLDGNRPENVRRFIQIAAICIAAIEAIFAKKEGGNV